MLIVTRCRIYMGLHKTAIHNASNLYIPKSRSKAQRQPTWFNSSIRHQLHCIHTLRRKHTKQPTTSNKIKLDTAEHELQQLMIQEKANYENKLINSHAYSNSNKIFRYISNLKGHSNLPAHLENLRLPITLIRLIYLTNTFTLYFYKTKAMITHVLLTMITLYMTLKYLSWRYMTSYQLLISQKQPVLMASVLEFCGTVPHLY